jgi:hypothetical protein
VVVESPQHTVFFAAQFIIIALFNAFLIAARYERTCDLRWGLTLGIAQAVFLLLLLLCKLVGPFQEPRGDTAWCCRQPARMWPWFLACLCLTGYFAALLLDVVFTFVWCSHDSEDLAILDVLTLLSLGIIYFGNFLRPGHVKLLRRPDLEKSVMELETQPLYDNRRQGPVRGAGGAGARAYQSSSSSSSSSGTIYSPAAELA